MQDNIYTSLADDIIVTNNNLYVFVPNLIQSVETQLMFNEANQNIYKISSDEYYTERRVIKDMIVEHDIGQRNKSTLPNILFALIKLKKKIDCAFKN